MALETSDSSTNELLWPQLFRLALLPGLKATHRCCALLPQTLANGRHAHRHRCHVTLPCARARASVSEKKAQAMLAAVRRLVLADASRTPLRIRPQTPREACHEVRRTLSLGGEDSSWSPGGKPLLAAVRSRPLRPADPPDAQNPASKLKPRLFTDLDASDMRRNR